MISGEQRFRAIVERLRGLIPGWFPLPTYPVSLEGTEALEGVLTGLEEAARERWPDALDTLSRVPEGTLNDAQRAALKSTRGLVLVQRGDWEGARAAYADALGLSEGSDAELESLVGLGLSELKLKNAGRAEELFERGLKLAGDSGRRDLYAAVLTCRGFLLRFENDTDGSVGCFAEARKVYREMADPHGEAVMLIEQGVDYGGRGDFERAVELLEEAVELESGFPAGLAGALLELGRVHLRRCEYATAKDVFVRAFAAAERSGSQRLVSSVHNNLGNVYFYQCDYSASIQAYERALSIYRRLGDEDSTSRIIHNIGSVFLNKGDCLAALRAYNQALELERKKGNDLVAARCLGNIGVVQRARCEYAASIEAYREALEIYTRHDDVFGQAVTKSNLSTVCLEIGSYSEAEELLVGSLELSRSAGIPIAEAQSLWKLGLIRFYTGDFDRAEEHFKEALRIHAEIKNQILEAWTLSSLGRLAVERGEYTVALKYFNQALELHRMLDHQEGEIESLANRGMVYALRGRRSEALADLKQAVQVAEGTQNPVEEARVMSRMGEVFTTFAEYEKAVPPLMDSYRTFHRYGVPLERAETLGRLGLLAKGLGHAVLACAYLRAAVEGYESLGALPNRVARLEELMDSCCADLDPAAVPKLDPDNPPQIPLESPGGSDG
jgi:tetratricopeptide (TPR) repeat protein